MSRIKDLTLADLGRKSVWRNTLVSDLLHRIDFVGKEGAGIRRIRDKASTQDCPEPQFEVNSFVTVTLTTLTEGRSMRDPTRGMLRALCATHPIS